MDTTTIFDSILISEYFVIGAVFLLLIDFFITVFCMLIRNDAMYKNDGAPLVTNIILVAIEVLLIIFAFVIFSHNKLLLLFSIPLLSTAVIMTIMLFWFFTQMKGFTVRSMEVFETLVGVIEAGDENLGGHSLHVQNLTMLLYEYLPLPDRLEINYINLQYASLFLDIGKLGIPRSIIDKKGKLLPKERELIQRHPEICTEIFNKIPSLTTVTYWVKYHHERVDGNGYYHLKGEEIPLASRILALADTYSAITMDRSYRPSLPYESAISELQLVAGTQLDARLVELFCSIPKKKVTDCMLDVRNRMKKYKSGDFRW